MKIRKQTRDTFYLSHILFVDCKQSLFSNNLEPSQKKTCWKSVLPGDLEEAKSEKASDEKYAKDLKATCAKKANAFDERQKLRKEDTWKFGQFFFVFFFWVGILIRKKNIH